MTDNKLQSIINETIKELDDIMNVTPRQAAKDVVKKAIGRSVRSKDPMFWPSGMLMLGLTSALGTLEKEDDGYKRCFDALERHLNLWKQKYGERLEFVDDSLAGYAVIQLYEQSHDPEHAKVIEKINAFIMDAATDQAGSIIYNPGKGNKYIFADGIGQSTMFMSAYIRMKLIVQDLLYNGPSKTQTDYYSESDYVNEIGKIYTQLKNFYKYGRDYQTGLIYHGYSLENNEKEKTHSCDYPCTRHGLLGWGRAYGWLFMGLTESACLEKYLGESGKNNAEKMGFSLIPWYIELCRIALDNQRRDGGWSWQIQAVDGHIDMSATGMIAYSLAKGIDEKVIDSGSELYEKMVDSLDKARQCMLEHSKGGVVMDALSSCDDFGVHYQNYGNFPWGQGAVLAALLRICDS